MKFSPDLSNPVKIIFYLYSSYILNIILNYINLFNSTLVGFFFQILYNVDNFIQFLHNLKLFQQIHSFLKGLNMM